MPPRDRQQTHEQSAMISGDFKVHQNSGFCSSNNRINGAQLQNNLRCKFRLQIIVSVL
jgi:hypothetical protein